MAEHVATLSPPTPHSRTSVQALLALLTPLAAIMAAFVLAIGFAPLGLLLPLALFMVNLGRQVRGISLHGPSAGRLSMLVVNAALTALLIIWLLSH